MTMRPTDRIQSIFLGAVLLIYTYHMCAVEIGLESI